MAFLPQVVPGEKRERLLALWLRDRLDDAPAAEWAANSLPQIRGAFGHRTLWMIDFVGEHAASDPKLSAEVKKVWRLLRHAAHDARAMIDEHVVFELSRKIEAGGRNPIGHEEVDLLVELVRPRLTVNAPSRFADSARTVERRPLSWLNWGFSNNTRFFQTVQRANAIIAKLPEALVERFLARASGALSDAMALADDIEWLNAERDIANQFVHRIFSNGATQQAEEADEDDDERDPDWHNTNFAPVVRLLSASVERLAETDVMGARHIARSWRECRGGLFLRLFAFSSWKSTIWPGDEVASFLKGIDQEAFWRWQTFPEVATLRVLRWNDLTTRARKGLAQRLLMGPSPEMFDAEWVVPEEATAFYRDHELARLVDAGISTPVSFLKAVEKRRSRDASFPRHVPKLELGRPRPKVSAIPSGEPGRFANVAKDQLLATLIASTRERWASDPDHASAFARTLEGKIQILAALKETELDADATVAPELLLSYPHDEGQDVATLSEIAQKTAEFGSSSPQSALAGLTQLLLAGCNR